MATEDILDNDKPLSFRSGKDAEDALGQFRAVVREVRDAGKLQGETLKQLGDRLVDIQRAQVESQTREVGGVEGRDGDLKRYVRQDGSVRMTRSVETISFAGKTHEIERAGLLDDSERTPGQEALQVALERRSVARLLMKGKGRTPVLDADVAKAAMALPKSVRDALEPKIRALYDGSGVGDDFVVDGYMPSIYRAFEVPKGLAAAFDTVQVSNETFVRPSVTTGARPYLKSEISSDTPAAFTPSTPATDQAAIQIKALAVRILVGEHLAEDSAIAAIPFAQSEIGMALEDGYEDVMVNGDTAGTHQDAIASWNARSRWGASGLGGAADHRRMSIGLRARAADVSNTSDGSAAQTAAGILANIATIGERAMDRVILVTSPEVLVQKLFALSEVLTLEKFGPNATILSGQLASLFGSPIVVSRFVTADLAATGLYTGSSSYSGVLAVHRGAWATYQKRGQVVEVDKEISSGHYEVVGSIRKLFATMDSSAVKNVHWSYKWL